MRSVRLSSLVAFTAVIASCSAPETGEVAERQRICPDCRANARGGDTSDFGGGQENCRETKLPVDTTTAAELGLQAALTAASSPLELPLRWLDASGAESTVEARVELGEPAYYAIGVEPSAACRDSIRIPATVELETADGGLLATVNGLLRLRRGELSWELRASTDLSTVSGNRELGLDPNRAHEGRLDLTMRGFSGERRGSVAARVLYLDDAEGKGQDPRVAFELYSFTPWSGRFPIDGCDAETFPFARETAHSFLGGHALPEIIHDLAGELPAALPARYRDGSSTEVSVELGALPASVCLGEHFGNAVARWAGNARVTSDDERVDAELTSVNLELAGTSGEPLGLLLTRAFEPTLPSELELAMGFTGLDPAKPSLAGTLRVDFEWGSGALQSFGNLRVSEPNGAAVECLIWPPGEQTTGCAAERF